MDVMSPLCAAVLLNFNTDCIPEILNHPKFDSRKSDIANTLLIRNSRVTIDLIYDFDCQHDHLIDEKIKEGGSSCLTDSKITIGLINFLLDHGVDPNIPDKDGVYPLNYYIQSYIYAFMINLINSSKIDFNKKLDPKLSTYLHSAASYGFLKAIQLIIAGNLCDINVTNDFGETPLMLACENKVDCVKYLFIAYENLDFHHKNNKGEDAIKIVQNIIKSKNIDADKKSQDVKEQAPVDDNSENISRDDYLKLLITLIDEAFQKKNNIAKCSLNYGQPKRFLFNFKP